MVENEERNQEVGGDYEFSFDNGSRLSLLLLANREVRNFVRERFEADPATDPLSKDLFIDSRRERKELHCSGQLQHSADLKPVHACRSGACRYSAGFQFARRQCFRQRAALGDGMVDLSPVPSLSNLGTRVEELRYEGFLFHNWTL